MYLRVRKPNGEEVLDEISLKKSKDVNFLNSGAGQFKDWLGDDLPDDINQSVYKENQRESIASTGQNIKSDIESLLNDNPEKAKELQKVFKSKGLDFNKALDNLQNKKGDYRKSSSVVMTSIKAIADWPSWGKRNDKGPNQSGNTVAQQYLRDASEKQAKFIDASIKSLSENPKMKEGMMSSIREEFPLKAVSEGEETMAIGDSSLDVATMENIFGTSDFEKIKENLKVDENPPDGPPHLAFQAGPEGDMIRIAEIKIRQDDIGKRDTFELEEYDKLVRFMRSYVADKNCKDENEKLERMIIRDYVLISSNSCMRVGELRQLTWGDVTRIETIFDDKEKEHYLAHINVRAETSKVKTKRKIICRGGDYFERLKKRQRFTSSEHLVFTSVNGTSGLSSQKWAKHWRALMTGIGISLKEWKDDRNLTWYSLRHFGITMRVMSNVNILDIAKLAGTSVNHIENTYLKYKEESMRTQAMKSFSINKDGTVEEKESS